MHLQVVSVGANWYHVLFGEAVASLLSEDKSNNILRQYTRVVGGAIFITAKDLHALNRELGDRSYYNRKPVYTVVNPEETDYSEQVFLTTPEFRAYMLSHAEQYAAKHQEVRAFVDTGIIGRDFTVTLQFIPLTEWSGNLYETEEIKPVTLAVCEFTKTFSSTVFDNEEKKQAYMKSVSDEFLAKAAERMEKATHGQ